METGHCDGNGREESAGRILDGRRTVANFGNRKALRDATDRMMMTIYTRTHAVIWADGRADNGQILSDTKTANVGLC